MKVFLDFDDTVFNTRDFVQAFGSVFLRYGVPEDVYTATHEQSYRSIGEALPMYDEELQLRHIEALQQGFDIEGIREETQVFLQDTSRFVFPDMHSFLAKSQAKGVELYLLSFGGSLFQNKKIAGAGLERYFKEVFVVAGKKYVPIRDVMRDAAEPLWFFDDRAEYIEDVKGNIASVKSVQVMRPKRRYADEKSVLADFCISDFHTLTEAL